MRRISLQTKYILLILIWILLVPLLFLGFFADHEQYKNALYIVPNSNHTSDVLIEEIEKINEEKFLTTYMVEQEKRIKAIHENHIVQLRGTNYTYPFILNYPLVNGGFFTQLAQEAENKVAVLNEDAAFNMFGGNDCIGNEIIIDNLIYTVVGVLNDKDEDNKNVYIPITLLKQSPNAFVSLLSSDISEEYIKAQYRNLGITTEHYDFVNLNALISMIKEKGILSCILLITIMLIFLVKWAISRGIKQYEIINKLLKKNYLKELLTKEKRFLGLFFGNLVLIATLVYIIGILGLYIFTMFLNWGDLSTFTTKHSNSAFMGIFDSIQKSLVYSHILFVLFLVLLFALTYSFARNENE